MVKLDCSVYNCAFNSDNSCKRNDIMVEGNEAVKPSETSCSSFAPRGCGCGASNLSDEPRKETEVSCSAETCVFNRARKCNATHIGIAGTDAGHSKETLCKSFVCE